MTTKKTQPTTTPANDNASKAETLKKHKLSKAEKQSRLKPIVVAIPESDSEPEQPQPQPAPKQISPTDAAANEFYVNVTLKKFKSARKEVAIPAFNAGAEYAAKEFTKALTDLVVAVEAGKEYGKVILAAKKILTKFNS